jgi:hypothetical protein
MENRVALLDHDFIVESVLRAGEFHLDAYENGGVDDGIGSDGRGSSPSIVASRLQAAARSARVFKKAEAETVRRVLDEIDMIALKRSKEGLCEFNFSLGVCNCVSVRSTYDVLFHVVYHAACGVLVLIRLGTLTLNSNILFLLSLFPLVLHRLHVRRTLRALLVDIPG